MNQPDYGAIAEHERDLIAQAQFERNRRRMNWRLVVVFASLVAFWVAVWMVLK